MKSWALRFIFGAVFALGFVMSASAQTASGVIKIGKVQGEASRVFADGRPAQPVKTGDTVVETDTIVTGNNSLVVLVFMNGSSVKVGADSKLKIEEFKMDPLDEDIVVAALEKEPSKSKTTLELSYGEMVGDVKKLNTADGSSFKINTPVGAAGIRGTTFRIVFRPSGDGRTFTFQLATSEGRVLFEGTAQMPANIEVPDQEQIAITAEANVDPTTGAVEITKIEIPAATQPISQDNKALIEVVAKQVIQESQQATTITTTEQQQSQQQSNPPAGNDTSSTPPPSESPSTDSTKTGDQGQSNTPVPTTRPQPLTSGAGGA